MTDLLAPVRSLKTSLRARLIRPGLHRLAYVSGTSALRARSQQGDRILMFHGIDGRRYPVDVFEAQLRYVRRHFTVVPLDSIVRRLEQPGAPSSRCVALTFDDGFRNHATTVYPLLRRLQLPATFFVCPGLIEQGRWLWSAEVDERVGSVSPASRGTLLREFPIASPTAAALKTWMKTLPVGPRLDAERRLRALTPYFAATPAQRTRLEPMSWRDLASLDRNLVTVGSHTMSHPMLTTLDEVSARAEIVNSRRRLEEMLGRAVEFFCYPAGAYSESVTEEVRRHYRAAVTTDPGFVRPHDDRHLLRRVPAVPQLPFFAWLLHRPSA
ncbi:MAG: polysaccharide deacetylase family protein [Candidatus Rokuibacteriota bacterium]|nr:MAG: polysaccharide deacetylase family protein [Candidatus Rokubacteria bacterium]